MLYFKLYFFRLNEEKVISILNVPFNSFMFREQNSKLIYSIFYYIFLS